MASDDEKTRWQYLNEEAKAGRLFLDPSVAKNCRDASNKQIDLFLALKGDLQSVATVTGLGRFTAADELARMLGMKAIGGERDFLTAFEEHIDVLTLIRDTIDISVKKYEDQDQALGQGLNAQGANILGGN